MVRTRLNKVQSYFQPPAANRPAGQNHCRSIQRFVYLYRSFGAKGAPLSLSQSRITRVPSNPETRYSSARLVGSLVRSLFVTPGRLSPRIRIGQTRSTTVLCADVMRRERSLILAYARTAYVLYYVQRNGLSPIIMQQSTGKN